MVLLLALLAAGAVSGEGQQSPRPQPSAQYAAAPRLLRRTADTQDAPEESGSFRPGRSGLPDEASGTYALGPDPGEAIEVILNGEGSDCRLQGYVTRMGDGESDRGATLTYFFRQTSVSPQQLQFITRQVHGAWWSFSGHIDRGSAPRSSEKGYYLLIGMLTEHFVTGESQPSRVSLPLLPQGVRQSQ